MSYTSYIDITPTQLTPFKLTMLLLLFVAIMQVFPRISCNCTFLLRSRVALRFNFQISIRSVRPDLLQESSQGDLKEMRKAHRQIRLHREYKMMTNK